MSAFAVVRIRGTVGVPRKIADTLAMLRLHKRYHCVIVPDTKSYRGMLQKAKDWITWGEVDPEVVEKLLLVRGRTVGDGRVDDGFVRKHTAYGSVRELAEALARGEVKLSDIPNLKPVFRLHPPIGGLRSMRKSFAEGGDLGYRGRKINELILRMLGPGFWGGE